MNAVGIPPLRLVGVPRRGEKSFARKRYALFAERERGRLAPPSPFVSRYLNKLLYGMIVSNTSDHGPFSPFPFSQRKAE
jgi:hypothetical protein